MEKHTDEELYNFLMETDPEFVYFSETQRWEIVDNMLAHEQVESFANC